MANDYMDGILGIVGIADYAVNAETFFWSCLDTERSFFYTRIYPPTQKATGLPVYECLAG